MGQAPFKNPCGDPPWDTDQPPKKKARKAVKAAKPNEAEASTKQQQPAPSGIGIKTSPPPGGWSAAKYVGHGVWKVAGKPMYAKPYHDGDTIKTEWTPV